MNKSQVASPSILLIYIIIVFLYHLFGYIGHFGFDDLHYAELAVDLLHGSVNFEDHYAYRFPVILFTFLSYLIFGISDFASSLPALAITITILIIVSLENTAGTSFWEALEINRYLKAYSNWWPVTFDVTIPKKDLRSDSSLKVYVWNSDKQKVYIDNFGIRITMKL